MRSLVSAAATLRHDACRSLRRFPNSFDARSFHSRPHQTVRGKLKIPFANWIR